MALFAIIQLEHPTETNVVKPIFQLMCGQLAFDIKKLFIEKTASGERIEIIFHFGFFRASTWSDEAFFISEIYLGSGGGEHEKTLFLPDSK